MKKITIYTTADKRPDFIAVQYNSLKKFCSDDYEFIVLNNALDSRKRRTEISQICSDLNIACIEVQKESRFRSIGKQKVFTWRGTYRNANVGTAYPLKWAWQEICNYNAHTVFVIIDSDMFLCKPTSFIESLGAHDAAFMIQYRGLDATRGHARVVYPWNGICIFNTERLPNLAALNWDCGILPDAYIEGYSVDVGGYGHYWLQKNKISLQHISEYAIHNFVEKESTIWLEATLNGNYHYSFEYHPTEKTVSDFHCYETNWTPSDNLFPHFPPHFVETLTQKTIAYFETYILGKQTYPAPTFLGFIEFETFKNTIDPSIIHSKAGSGYMGFGATYGKVKLTFIRDILGL